MIRNKHRGHLRHRLLAESPAAAGARPDAEEFGGGDLGEAELRERGAILGFGHL
jgi:hypothetical protein